MKRFLRKLCSRIYFPLGWTLFTIILCCLPGSDIPSTGIFAAEGIDKIVHVILFGGIVFFWGYYWIARPGTREEWRKLMILIALLSIVLGVVLEFLQLYYIPGRTFDLIDMGADATGAILAYTLLVFPNRKAENGL
jgi:hypothetical protein